VIEIKNRYTNEVIYTYQGDSLVGADLSEAYLYRANISWTDLSWANLSEANLYRANLSRANLSRANLYGANLSRANLSGADLSGADLSRAYLSGAYLSGANLSWAKLSGAKLSGSKLSGANLYGADLSGANLKNIKYLSPVSFLLADWGEVSDSLCTELMRYDASSHPNPELFLEWARNNGSCPYDGISIPRAANFQEKKSPYSPGPSKSAYELMKMVIKEKCKGE
jgi:hypothetical protein